MQTYNNKIKKEKTSIIRLNILFATSGAILLGFIYNYTNEIIAYPGTLFETTVFNFLFFSYLSTTILFLFIPIIAYNANAASKVFIRNLKNKQLKEEGLDLIDKQTTEEITKISKNFKKTIRILFAVLGIILFYIAYFHVQSHLNGFAVEIETIVLYATFALATGIALFNFEKNFKASAREKMTLH